MQPHLHKIQNAALPVFTLAPGDCFQFVHHIARNLTFLTMTAGIQGLNLLFFILTTVPPLNHLRDERLLSSIESPLPQGDQLMLRVATWVPEKTAKNTEVKQGVCCIPVTQHIAKRKKKNNAKDRTKITLGNGPPGVASTGCCLHGDNLN